MGASNIAAVHATWRGLKHRARLLLDHMALQSLDADDPPIYVGGWRERAGFLGYDPTGKRKSAWEGQNTAVQELIAAGVVVLGTAVEHKSGTVREAFVIDTLGTHWSKKSLDAPSKKVLDTYPGKRWTWSKNPPDNVQEILGTRTQEEPEEPHSGDRTTHPDHLTRCRGCGGRTTIDGECVTRCGRQATA
ncbi:MAG: hypothetical protein NTX33_05895 [Propionibacteriales bacterium]|nr:hypothetical protein [Propionibacteriales bacterium]